MYIHDYFLKRKLHASAKAFQAEAKVSTEPVGKIIRRKLEKTYSISSVNFSCSFLEHVKVTCRNSMALFCFYP